MFKSLYITLLRSVQSKLWFFRWSRTDVRVGPQRRLTARELTLSIWCWRRFLIVPWTARRSNQSILKEISPETHWKGWCWNSSTLATWYKEPSRWKIPWCWERLRARGERGNRIWDGWMASLTQWTWIWASSRRWWRTGKPGVFMRSLRVGYDSDWTITTKLIGILWYHKWHIWDISPRTCYFSPNTFS